MLGSTLLCTYLSVLVCSPLLFCRPIVYRRPLGVVRGPLTCAPTQHLNEYSSNEAVTSPFITARHAYFSYTGALDFEPAAILRKYHKYLAIINCVSLAQGVKDETRHVRHIPVRLTCEK